MRYVARRANDWSQKCTRALSPSVTGRKQRNISTMRDASSPCVHVPLRVDLQQKTGEIARNWFQGVDGERERKYRGETSKARRRKRGACGWLKRRFRPCPAKVSSCASRTSRIGNRWTSVQGYFCKFEQPNASLGVYHKSASMKNGCTADPISKVLLFVEEVTNAITATRRKAHGLHGCSQLSTLFAQQTQKLN